MTKLEIVISSEFRNYVQNYALAQNKEIEEFDFDKIYNKYLYIINDLKKKNK